MNNRYKWSGHSVVLGRYKNNWLDREYVLKWFGRKEGEAKKAYRLFVKKGVDLGKRPDLFPISQLNMSAEKLSSLAGQFNKMVGRFKI